MSRRAPRPLALALDPLVEDLAPPTALAAVQRAWADAVGPVVAAEAEPVAERDGTVTVSCRSSVWAEELSLLAPDVVRRLNAALGADRVRGLRCVAGPPRRPPR